MAFLIKSTNSSSSTWLTLLKLVVVVQLTFSLLAAESLVSANVTEDDDDVGFDDIGTTNIVTAGGFFEDNNRCVFPWVYEDENGNSVVFNSCKPFEDEPKPFLEGVNADPTSVVPERYIEAPENTGATTGNILAWCPNNYDDAASGADDKRFYPGDTYAATGSKTKKHWGFCTCSGDGFWQRLPEFDTNGELSTRATDAKRLEQEGCLLSNTVTKREEQFYSVHCKDDCDNTEGCNGFEYFRDEDNNHCLLFGCIVVSTVSPTEDVVKYKKQVKRKCEDATTNLILGEGDDFPIEIITNSPTTEPTESTPTMSPSTTQTSSPSVLVVTTSSPTPEQTTSSPTTSSPTPEQTTSDKEDRNLAPTTPSPAANVEGGISAAAWAVPLSLILLGVVVGGGYYAKNRKEEEESAAAGAAAGGAAAGAVDKEAGPSTPESNMGKA